MPQPLPDQPFPRRPDPSQTGEVGSEGGSPGDLLRPGVRPAGDDAEPGRSPRGIPSVLLWLVAIPVLVILLWFATSLVSR